MRLNQTALCVGISALALSFASTPAFANDALEDFLAELSQSEAFSYKDASIKNDTLAITEPRFELSTSSLIPADDDAPENLSVSYLWEASSLTVEQGDGPDKFRITLPQKQTLKSDFGGLSDDVELPSEIAYEMQAEEMILLLEKKDGQHLFDLTAQSLAATIDHSVTPPEGGAEISLDLAFGIEAPAYSGQLPADFEGEFELTAEDKWALNFSSGKMHGRGQISPADADDDLDFTFDLDRAKGRYAVAGGALNANAEFYDLDFTITPPENSAMPVSGRISVEIDALKQASLLPLLGSDDAQEASIDYQLRGIELDPKLWNLIDPKDALTRELNRLTIALSGTAVMPLGLFELGRLDPEDLALAEPPLPENAVIEEFLIEALGAKIGAQGSFDLSEVIDGGPPSGKATITLGNWRSLLESMMAAEYLPPQQGQMALFLLENFVKPGKTETESTIDIGLADGMILLNGVPFAPLPGIAGPK